MGPSDPVEQQKDPTPARPGQNFFLIMSFYEEPRNGYHVVTTQIHPRNTQESFQLTTAAKALLVIVFYNILTLNLGHCEASDDSNCFLETHTTGGDEHNTHLN